jgi:sugar phosphate isomerase/epimerase
MAPAIEKIKQAGMIFSYHNHHHEFARHNGRTMMDYILDATDPSAVGICFDAYWAHYAGMDETQFILDHGDRVLCTHTKDMVTIGGQPAMTEMLSGNINYDRFFDACDEKGIAWHFVEQDVCRMNTLDSIRISRENLIARYGMDD